MDVALLVIPSTCTGFGRQTYEPAKGFFAHTFSGRDLILFAGGCFSSPKAPIKSTSNSRLRATGRLQRLAAVFWGQ
jgi:hypothetical protein